MTLFTPILLTMISLPPAIQGQQFVPYQPGAAISSRPIITGAPSILPLSAKSDLASVGELKQVLEASGGQARWSSIHSATLRIRLGNKGSGPSVERLFMDDWSTSDARYRRAVAGSQKAPKDHDAETEYKVHTPYGDRKLPEFDQAHLVAGNLPAAAASIILSNPKYIVKSASGTRCMNGVVCIDVYVKKGQVFIRQEEWVISQDSHLPQTIDLLLESLFSGSRFPVEEFTFKTFDQNEGVLVPTSGTIQVAEGKPIATTLVHCELNHGFNKAKFDEEAQKK